METTPPSNETEPPRLSPYGLHHPHPHDAQRAPGDDHGHDDLGHDDHGHDDHGHDGHGHDGHGYHDQGYAGPQGDGPPPDPGQRQSFFRRRVAPVGAAILAFLAKLKAALLFLGQFKLLVTAGSMAVSLVAYASIWGWAFGLGFVLLLLVHEMGHVIALRREGIRASAPMFVPFLGAVISSRSLGDDALAEARVGLAGPILGSAGAGVCLLLWKLTGDDFWRALGFTGLFLNLFNLLPVVPLDGGRAMAAMSPWMWIAGFCGVIALAVAFPNPVIIIIAIFAAMETWRRLKARRHGDEHQEAYYRVSVRGRTLVGLTYLGLIVLLVLGMHATHLHRTL